MSERLQFEPPKEEESTWVASDPLNEQTTDPLASVMEQQQEHDGLVVEAERPTEVILEELKQQWKVEWDNVLTTDNDISYDLNNYNFSDFVSASGWQTSEGVMIEDSELDARRDTIERDWLHDYLMAVVCEFRQAGRNAQQMQAVLGKIVENIKEARYGNWKAVSEGFKFRKIGQDFRKQGAVKGVIGDLRHILAEINPTSLSRSDIPLIIDRKYGGETITEELLGFAYEYLYNYGHQISSLLTPASRPQGNDREVLVRPTEGAGETNPDHLLQGSDTPEEENQS